jgi:hypothetical protein
MSMIIKKWTEEEKKLMADVAGEVYTMVKIRFKGNVMMASQTMNFILQGFNDEVGVEKIMILNKDGKVDTIQEEQRARQIIEAMKQSECNIVLFRDCPEVWMQYYMGIYLKKPTYVIVKRSDIPVTKDRFGEYALQRGITFVNDFSESELKKAMEEIQEMIGQ